MRKLALMLSLILFVGLVSTNAQTKAISGKVVDNIGEAIPGVSIIVKGTTIGTVTRPDGTYQLNVPESTSAIIYSFVGMTVQEVAYSGQSTINVTLDSDTEDLDEVIVVAYGTTTKEAFTGSATSIRGDKIMKEASPVSADRALQGYVSGVRVTQQAGQPGAAATIQIRGIGSINGNTDPLYVLDGIPMETGNFSEVHESSDVLALINPNDIESISVLKDAAATSLYGSRGANGVVIITTKSGKKGKTKISVNYEQSWSDIAMPDELTGYYMNGTEYTEYSLEALKNYYLYSYGALPGLSNGENWDDASVQSAALDWAYENLHDYAGIIHPDDNLDGSFDYDSLSDEDKAAYVDRARNTDWGDLLFRIGKSTKFDVSARGGNEKSKHYMSLGYYNQEGIYIGSEYERYTGKINFENEVSKFFKYSINQSLAYSNQEGAASGDWYYSNPVFGMKMLNPTAPAYLDDEETEYNETPGFSTSVPNYLQTNEEESSVSKTFRSSSNLALTFSFTDYLSFKTTNGLDIITLREKDIWSIDSPNGESTDGYIYSIVRQVYDATTSNMLDFHKTFDQHRVSAVAAYEVNDYYNTYVSAEGTGYSSDKLLYLSNASTPTGVGEYSEEDRLVSYVGRLDYSYDNKYYATLGWRRDGSSRLASDYRWGNFFATSAGWNISRESFMQSISWLDNMKIRASYGTNGNLPSSFYDSQALFSVSSSYNSSPATKLSSLGSSQLTWETSTTFDCGVDFSVFDGKLSGTLDYYNKLTDDLISDAPTSFTTGFDEQTVNAGKLRNTGFELALKSINVELTNGFSWETEFNISQMKATIEEWETDYDDFPHTYTEGEDLHSFKLREWAGVNPQTGQPQWYVNSENSDGSYDKTITSNSSEANKIIVGKGYPDFFGGITNRFAYKGVELSFLITYTLGGELYDNNYSTSESDGSYVGNYSPAKVSGENYWQNPGDVTERPIVIYGDPYNSSYNSNRRIKSSDHARLKNLTVSYNLPKTLIENIGIKNVRIFLQGNNLLTFYKYKFINPEVDLTGETSGASYFPLTKSWKFGLNVNF